MSDIADLLRAGDRIFVAGSSNEPTALLDALRNWRAETAREHNVPAYVVFHDSTLEAIAASQPQSLDALGNISGIGAKKLERYGQALLELTANAD